MANFKIQTFSGLRPRFPESLLPDGAATIAHNCDFAYGELRNTKSGFELLQMQNNPLSVYTEDGLSFYSWTTDVDAVRSPLAKDQFNRMYYTGDGGMRVADRNGTRVNGGTPSSSYLVGVPRPTVLPTFTIEQRILNEQNTDFEYRFHYELSGVKYQEQSITPIYWFFDTNIQLTLGHPIARAEATPEQAVGVYRIKATDKASKAKVFDIYTENSGLNDKNAGYKATSTKIDTPEALPVHKIVIEPSLQEANKETRAYVYTYVNVYNEEGPASDPALIDVQINESVAVTVVRDASTIEYAPIKEVRVYRTPTGSTAAAYFYVGSIGVQGATGPYTFTDKVRGEQLNEPLSSMNYYPPDSGLVGLMALPNGILAAWKGNELHFSEAYKPWAWPPQYVKTTTNAIVGGIVHGSGAVITTRGHPYLLSGVSPDSMTASKVNVDQAGVSKWSIAVVDGAVVYACNDGMVAITGASASLVSSQKFFTREVWRAAYGNGLSGMRFSVWDGRLVVFSGTNSFTPFMIRFDEADGTMTELPGFVASCGFVSQLSDQFYFVNGNRILQFNAGSQQQAVWQSKEYVIARPCNFAIANAVVEGEWEIEFWAYTPQSDGFITSSYFMKHREVLATGSKTFRLPSGYESDRYRIKITGTGRFRELRVAQSARELAAV